MYIVEPLHYRSTFIQHLHFVVLTCPGNPCHGEPSLLSSPYVHQAYRAEIKQKSILLLMVCIVQCLICVKRSACAHDAWTSICHVPTSM